MGPPTHARARAGRIDFAKLPPTPLNPIHFYPFVIKPHSKKIVLMVPLMDFDNDSFAFVSLFFCNCFLNS